MLCCAEAGAQAAGTVIFALGEVAVTRAGRDLPLSLGDPVQVGDVVSTGEASSAQLRFADRSVVALRSKSRFEVTEFQFTGSDDGSSNLAFRLLRGGIRTLSGLIGSVRPERYRVRTLQATIGIRGTMYTLVHCEDDCLEDDGSPVPDGTYGLVYEGRVIAANAAGEAEFGAEEAFYVADPSTLPQALATRPGILRDRLDARARREERREQMEARAQAFAAMREQLARLANVVESRLGFSDAQAIGVVGTRAAPIVVVGDLTDPGGNVALIGPGLGAGVAFSSGLGPVSFVDGGRGTVIELDGERHTLERFIFNGGLQSGSRNNALVSEGGSFTGDGGAAWGRWAPGATVTIGGSTGSPSTGLHFFFGNLTPESLFASVPATATAVRYDYAGGTRPTNEQGHVGQFLSGQFIVNFTARSIAGELNYRVENVSYHLPVPVTPIVTGRGFAGFTVNPRNAGNWLCPTCATSSGILDAYSVTGLFLGSRAQGLGVSFATEDARVGRTAGVGIFRCVSGGCR